MKKHIVLLFAFILSIAMLAGCGNGGSQQSSGNTTPPASTEPAAAADSVETSGKSEEVRAGEETPASEEAQASEETQADEGERIRLEISNEDTKKGYLSAICPASWYDHSDGEYLFFSESETPADYAKPYIRLGYAPTATLTGGSGEDIAFELGSRNWDGLYDNEYNTYNATHQLNGGGGLSVISMGVGPDDAVFEMVVGSIWVEF